MTRCILCLVFGMLGLVCLGLVLTNVSAQPAARPPVIGPGMQAGRFVVAHSTPERIVILDTATGQVYVATERDFKKMSEMPKVGSDRLIRPPFREKEDPDRPRLRERLEKERRERERREDERREQDRREKDRREKEKEER